MLYHLFPIYMIPHTICAFLNAVQLEQLKNPLTNVERFIDKAKQ